MSTIKKLIFIALALALVFAGLWLVIMNNQPLALNLLFVTTPSTNAGLVVLVSFMVGALVGFLVGFNILEMLRLNNRLYWLRREVRQLQDALGDKR